MRQIRYVLIILNVVIGGYVVEGWRGCGGGLMRSMGVKRRQETQMVFDFIRKRSQEGVKQIEEIASKTMQVNERNERERRRT